MPEHITEALPEGDDRVWVSLDDGFTRLIDLTPLMALASHRSLRLRRLIRCPAVSANGQFVYWPGGAHISADAITRAARKPDSPLSVLSVVPFGRRYRPLSAVLRHAEPNLHGYHDVRPQHHVLPILGLNSGEFDVLARQYHPAPQDLVLARFSDLALFLREWFPDQALPSLLRQPWPYSIRRYPGSRLLDTALGCLKHGRIDLIEGPLLLLATEGL